MKLSVIVPFYNVEEYIERCLDSLVNQTYKNLEIILVNDGTKDNSQKIVDKFVKKYPKLVKSFIKENGGLSDARNFGFKKAKGDYVTFVDSDDYVEKDMYEKMMKKALEKDFDMVVCDLYYDYGDIKKRAYSNVSKDILDKKEIKDVMLNIYPAAWNKIYKRSILKDVEFKKNVWFEDVEFMYRLLPNVTSIGVVNEPFVNYVQREGAITKTFDERLYHQIENWNGLLAYYKENKIYEEYKENLEYCYVRYLYGSFIRQALNYPDKQEFKKAVESAILNVKTQFPKYRKNKLFYKTGIHGFYLLWFNKLVANMMYIMKKR